jgi:hypothetical protein
MQTNPHSSSNHCVRFDSLWAAGLCSGPDRISIKRFLCSWVCSGRIFDADLLSFVRYSGRLAVPAVSPALCSVQCLLAPRMLSLRPEMLGWVRPGSIKGNVKRIFSPETERRVDSRHSAPFANDVVRCAPCAAQPIGFCSGPSCLRRAASPF